MKRTMLLLILLLSILSPCRGENQEPEGLKEDVIPFSEAMGYYLAEALKEPIQKWHLDFDSILRGMRLSMEGNKAPLSMKEYESKVMELQKVEYKDKAQKNLEEAEAFLRAQEEKKDVIFLEKGKIHYTILKKGEGKEVHADSTPLIHFVITSIDGTTLCSTEAEEPIHFRMEEAIPGLQKGILGMKKGEKRRLYIHPDRAFGAGNLPPNLLLIVDIEILETDTEKHPNSLSDENKLE